jgi:uncharacterized protein involved in cysteine biosynthesis
MDASGTSREGLMTFIPLTVLLFIVIYVMGGPAQFISVVVHWVTDVINYAGSWIRHL